MESHRHRYFFRHCSSVWSQLSLSPLSLILRLKSLYSEGCLAYLFKFVGALAFMARSFFSQRTLHKWRRTMKGKAKLVRAERWSGSFSSVSCRSPRSTLGSACSRVWSGATYDAVTPKGTTKPMPGGLQKVILEIPACVTCIMYVTVHALCTLCACITRMPYVPSTPYDAARDAQVSPREAPALLAAAFEWRQVFNLLRTAIS